MNRIVWLTDIHLNFLPENGLETLAIEILKSRPDQIWITGDIADSTTLAERLNRLSELLDRPIRFVLGNHDYYHSSFDAVERAMDALSCANPTLHYLTVGGIQPLSKKVALLGHDGWADGGYGDFETSTVRLNDYKLIADFKGLEKPALLAKMRERGGLAAAHFRHYLTHAFKQFEHVYLLTHFPPLREACKFEGHVTSDNWLPHLANRQAAEVLIELMAAHPHRKLTVLCGHTHHASREVVGGNLEVITGAAEYRSPTIQKIIEIP